MNRRGFLAAAIGAVLAPKELIQEPIYKHVTYGTARFVGPISNEEMARIGALYSKVLARSLIQTKEVIVANLLNRGFV